MVETDFQNKWYYRLLKVIFYFFYLALLLINIGITFLVILDGEGIVEGLLVLIGLPIIILFFELLRSTFFYIVFGKWEFRIISIVKNFKNKSYIKKQNKLQEENKLKEEIENKILKPTFISKYGKIVLYVISIVMLLFGLYDLILLKNYNSFLEFLMPLLIICSLISHTGLISRLNGRKYLIKEITPIILSVALILVVLFINNFNFINNFYIYTPFIFYICIYLYLNLVQFIKDTKGIKQKLIIFLLFIFYFILSILTSIITIIYNNFNLNFIELTENFFGYLGVYNLIGLFFYFILTKKLKLNFKSKLLLIGKGLLFLILLFLLFLSNLFIEKEHYDNNNGNNIFEKQYEENEITEEDIDYFRYLVGNGYKANEAKDIILKEKNIKKDGTLDADNLDNEINTIIKILGVSDNFSILEKLNYSNYDGYYKILFDDNKILNGNDIIFKKLGTGIYDVIIRKITDEGLMFNEYYSRTIISTENNKIIYKFDDDQNGLYKTLVGLRKGDNFYSNIFSYDLKNDKLLSDLVFSVYRDYIIYNDGNNTFLKNISTQKEYKFSDNINSGNITNNFVVKNGYIGIILKGFENNEITIGYSKILYNKPIELRKYNIPYSNFDCSGGDISHLQGIIYIEDKYLKTRGKCPLFINKTIFDLENNILLENKIFNIDGELEHFSKFDNDFYKKN